MGGSTEILFSMGQRKATDEVGLQRHKVQSTGLSGVCVYSGTCGSDECEEIGAVWRRYKSLSIIDF